MPRRALSLLCRPLAQLLKALRRASPAGRLIGELHRRKFVPSLELVYVARSPAARAVDVGQTIQRHFVSRSGSNKGGPAGEWLFVLPRDSHLLTAMEALDVCFYKDAQSRGGHGRVLPRTAARGNAKDHRHRPAIPNAIQSRRIPMYVRRLTTDRCSAI